MPDSPIDMADLRLVQADITALAVDAIVNAANPTLLGGGGVDGAIHRAAGPRLLEASRQIPELRPGVRCPTGQARITPGFELRARFVIHTVGPIWHGGHQGEADQLAACYRNALQLARDHDLSSIAFPAISCGVYGYPLAAAAGIAVRTIGSAIKGHDRPRQVLLVAFGPDVHEALCKALQRFAPS